MSAPMIAWVPVVNSIYRYFTRSDNATQSIDLPSVEVHDLESATDKSPRTLKYLLRANHMSHAILYHGLLFHNHAPHLLGSAYLLGASAEQLQAIYDEESKTLEPWPPSPAEISDSDWRKFLGNKDYQRAYTDFFEDELANNFNFEWEKVVEEYLFTGEKPLVNGLISGVGHPLIHLGYAYELQNTQVAMEALAMSAATYEPTHKYIDDPSYTRKSEFATTSPRELLHKLAEDKRFDGLLDSPDIGRIPWLMEHHEDLVLEYWNAWSIVDPLKQFHDSQEAAVALLVRTVKPGTHAYDFFICHVLTTSHAIRILIPLIPKKFHMSLVRQWWLLTILVYICQMRPKIDDDIGDKPTKQWNYVEDKALNGPWATDAHYVKALRAIKDAALTWGDVHERYLAAAVHFADDFHGWTGFARQSESDSHM